MTSRVVVAVLALALSASIADARSVKVCTPDLKRCVTVKLTARGCKTVMGYKICR